MPLNELRRRDSWPPTILRLNDEDLGDIAEIEDIDLNPFSYFLTSPDDLDDDIEDLSAGIESDEETAPAVREVSPSSLQRIHDSLEDESYPPHDVGRGYAMPVTLQAFTETHLAERSKKPAREAVEVNLPDTPRTPPTPTLRGRNTVRLAASRGRGRGQTRSLPGNRPHAWREPSPDVWSIPEEDEQNDEDLDIISPLTLEDSKQPLPSSLKKDEQGSSRQSIDGEATTSPSGKPKKRVRFVLP